MLSQEEFRKKFDRLVNVVWTLQYRLTEITEFERQWKALFDLLKTRTGKDCRIHILNSEIYRSFRWDKYHVIVSDLLSAIENEFQNEFSVIRQSINHLKLHPIEKYADPQRTVTFIGDQDFPRSEEEENERKHEITMMFAERQRAHIFEAMTELFPNFDPELPLKKENLDDLLSKLRTMKEEINSLRQVFAHKHQELVVQKHSASLDAENLDQLWDIANRLFKIIQKIGLVNHLSSYSTFSSSDCKKTVTDQLDLILFGSINSMHARFYQAATKEDFYWQAREKYWESEHLLSIVKDT